MSPFTVPSAALRRVLRNVKMFTAKDQARPVLNALKLWVQDGWLHALATDSYKLGHDRCEIQEKDVAIGPVLVDRNHVRLILDAVGRGKYPVMCSMDDGVFGVHAMGVKIHTPVLPDHERYPNLGHLWPKKLVATEVRGIGPSHLAVFAAVRVELVEAPIRFFFSGSFPLPTIAVKIGDTFDGVLAPVRLQEGQDELGKWWVK